MAILNAADDVQLWQRAAARLGHVRADAGSVKRGKAPGRSPRDEAAAALVLGATSSNGLLDIIARRFYSLKEAREKGGETRVHLDVLRVRPVPAADVCKDLLGQLE